MAERINSCQNYFDTLNDRFVPKASKGVDAIYQFQFDVGTWHVHVNDGSMSINQGAHDSPASTIQAKEADWVKIVNGDMNGLRAVMTRKMKVEGNIAAARKMQKIFPTN